MKEQLGEVSVAEIMENVLHTIGQYYQSDYAYYIEKKKSKLVTIYEWTAEGIESRKADLQKSRKKQWPEWLCKEMNEATGESRSVFLAQEEDVTAILAVVNVRREAGDVDLLEMQLSVMSHMWRLERKYKKQEYLGSYDKLTGLFNRNSFVAYTEQLQADELTSFGAVFVDINGLKNINQEYGDEYGDEMVVKVGGVLEEQFHGSDIFRLAGGEYLVVMKNETYEVLLQQVRKTEQAFEQITPDLATLGYSWQKTNIDPKQVIEEASAMMQVQKQKSDGQNKKKHLPLIRQDLQEDIQNGRFVVCLVPIVNVQTEKVIGAETQVRYQHPDLGVIDPVKYMAMLNDMGLSHYLDLYVLEEVCKALEKWEINDLPLMVVSVNFAPSTMQYENLLEEVLEFTQKYRTPCEYLQIEVTEWEKHMNMEMLSELCGKLRDANIKVLLDQFGSKQSRFSALTTMKFDGLKLDQSLLENIVVERKMQTVLRAIINMCEQLDVTVYATGVETQDQLNVLKELGCEYVQGELFNKPITMDTFEVRYMKS